MIWVKQVIIWLPVCLEPVCLPRLTVERKIFDANLFSRSHVALLQEFPLYCKITCIEDYCCGSAILYQDIYILRYVKLTWGFSLLQIEYGIFDSFD